MTTEFQFRYRDWRMIQVEMWAKLVVERAGSGHTPRGTQSGMTVATCRSGACKASVLSKRTWRNARNYKSFRRTLYSNSPESSVGGMIISWAYMQNSRPVFTALRQCLEFWTSNAPNLSSIGERHPILIFRLAIDWCHNPTLLPSDCWNLRVTVLAAQHNSTNFGHCRCACWSSNDIHPFPTLQFCLPTIKTVAR
jgi:hypothetical protein